MALEHRRRLRRDEADHAAVGHQEAGRRAPCACTRRARGTTTTATARQRQRRVSTAATPAGSAGCCPATGCCRFSRTSGRNRLLIDVPTAVGAAPRGAGDGGSTRPYQPCLPGLVGRARRPPPGAAARASSSTGCAGAARLRRSAAMAACLATGTVCDGVRFCVCMGAPVLSRARASSRARPISAAAPMRGVTVSSYRSVHRGNARSQRRHDARVSGSGRAAAPSARPGAC